MYLHLGQDTVVRTSEIVGIFDLENTSISKLTKEFLRASEKSGRVVNVSTELPKSFVVCGTRRNMHIYITPISTATLKKRSGYVETLSGLE